MANIPDLAFRDWIQEAHDQGSAQEQRAMMIALLARIVELLESQGRVRPG